MRKKLVKKEVELQDDIVDFHKDEFIKLSTWLYRKYPDVIDEYEEEDSTQKIIYT